MSIQLTIDGLQESGEMTKSAVISECGKYRYALWRTWAQSKPIVNFLLLNPSKADAKEGDPTCTRCINFAKSWGFGGLSIGNPFGFRATKRKDMKAADDPIGPDNDKWLLKLATEAEIVVCGWGTDGAFKGRDQEVKKLLSGHKLYYLELTLGNHPGHPLYLKGDLKPIKWEF